MASKTPHRNIIGPFLIIGTMLTLYLTINVGYDLFWVHNIWMYRDGLINKIGLVVLYANIPLLFIVGLISTISFFRNGHIWRPITKRIVFNIVLWLILAGLIIGYLIL